uniref:Uncharacterized protein n=1 Tax=Solanum lycopersicum TaxID=4081 RepID=A0A3Q7GBV3_SOLLC
KFGPNSYSQQPIDSSTNNYPGPIEITSAYNSDTRRPGPLPFRPNPAVEDERLQTAHSYTCNNFPLSLLSRKGHCNSKI